MSGDQAKNFICGYKMAKKEKAIYAPGELSRVRDKLGVYDQDEARKLAEKLGGEIGYERTEDQEKVKAGRTRRQTVDVRIGERPGRSKYAIELPPESGGEDFSRKKTSRRKEGDIGDDPSVPIRVSYWDRVKMDKFAGLPEFEIKSPVQVLYSMVSFFSEIPDYVSPVFVTRRVPEYYKKIEVLVVSTRNLFPRNNARRNERLKKAAPFVYAILDVIRYWDIEKISGDLARIQARPKSAKVSDFAEILRAVYRPLFVLEQLDLDTHIRSSYKVLYKLLFVEDPKEAENRYQELIRIALTAFSGIRRDIHYLLYPLLMKAVSAKFLPYGVFFAERKNRIMAFLNVTEANHINPAAVTIQKEDKDAKEKEANAKGETEQSQGSESSGQDPATQAEQDEVKEEELTEEEKARRTAEEAEKRALERGLKTLEILFPQAGWERLSTYPDLYPYFVGIFDLKRGIVNIAPTDPLLQIYVLMRTLEELFYGLRYVSFGTVPGSSGNMERVDTILGELINSWHYYLETSFEREYLPRMSEYARILEGSPEERASPYTRKLVTELHWLKRLFLLPYYKFESLVVAAPIQKKDTIPIYAKIRTLRKYLAAVATGIEMGTKAGGAEAHAPCDGIENPWEAYVFQVPNPLSIRLDAILTPKTRNNASLVYFCLAIVTVLDYLINDEGSWAYNPLPGPLFRSVDGAGYVPLHGVEEHIDADALFKQALKQRQKNDNFQKTDELNSDDLTSDEPKDEDK